MPRAISDHPATITVIDRRATLPCGCGCGLRATLPHLIKYDGCSMILPGCLESHRERQARQWALRMIVTQDRAWWRRILHFGDVYHLQRSIFSRHGAAAARRTALRSAVIYLVGTRAGLWVAKLWRKG